MDVGSNIDDNVVFLITLERYTMQDLDVINRQNARAEEEFAGKLVKEGKFVLIKYNGLNYYGYESFDNERDRNAAASDWTKGIGHRVKLLQPEPVAA